jgi:serine protease
MQSASNIEYIEEDRIMQIMATPSDPQYNNQWHYYESTGGLNLPTAWNSSTGSGVVVAVLDTGITNHPDLNANMLPGYDMISDAGIANDGNGRDSNPADTGDATAANECGAGRPARSSSWHGTHVAGTVAAVTNNGVGVAGVAYNAKVVPIRVLGKCGGFTSDIADGMIWAAGGSVPGVPNNPNPADVLNLSLGGGGSCDATSQAAINQAVSLGATVVVAAGNSNQNVSGSTPANCNNVVSVAAVGRNGGRAVYSNFGNLVDVAAPGGDQSTGTSDGVLSTLNSGSGAPAGSVYRYYQGTSMAAPHVAGAAALLYSLTSNIAPAAVESILKSTARNFPSSCSGCGAGIVDAAAAVATQVSGGGNSLTKGVAKTNLSGSTNSQIFYTINVPAGARNLSFNISGGSGDADMYVRFGAKPTTSNYNCRPWLNGNNETCNFSSPSTGTYHVMIRGYSAYSGVRLIVNYN